MTEKFIAAGTTVSYRYSDSGNTPQALTGKTIKDSEDYPGGLGHLTAVQFGDMGYIVIMPTEDLEVVESE